MPSSRSGSSIQKNWKTELALFAISAALALVVFGNEASHDFTSWLVQSEALIAGDSPYGLFFDIKPPGLITVTGLWVLLLGSSDAALFLLQVLLTFSSLTGVIRISRRLDANTWVWVLIFVSTIMLTGTYSNMPLSPELFALPLIIWSMYFLLSSEKSSNFYYAAAALSLAGTFKETFIPTLAVLLGLALAARSVRLLGVSVSIILIVQIMVFVPIFLVDGGADYLLVLEAKSQIFEFSLASIFLSVLRLGYTGFFHLGLAAPILVSGAFLITRVTPGVAPRILRSSELNLALGLIASLSAGLVLQQKPLIGHYALLLQFGILFLTLTLRRAILNKRHGLAVTVLLLLPGLSFGSSSASTGRALMERSLSGNFFWTQGPAETISTKLTEIPLDGACLHVATGWKAGAYYHYSQLRPCSKHFLASLTLPSESSRAQLSEDLDSQLGKVIMLVEKSDSDLKEIDPMEYAESLYPTDDFCLVDGEFVVVFTPECSKLQSQ